MSERIEFAAAKFQEGFVCSQAVLAAFADCFGLSHETALRIAAGFGGGIGRSAETCGAVSGAVMVLGMAYGAVRSDDLKAKQLTYQKAREFFDSFRQRHPSLRCRELLPCDISTAEGFQAAQDQKLFSTVCPQFVKDAVEIVEGLLPQATTEGR
jgi:C_GCAxxG_C_C family probable redox protein